MDLIDYDKIGELSDPSKIFDLSGKVGLITGGGGNMSRQFAEILVRSGACVILSDICQKKLKNMASYIKKQTGVEIQIYNCDFSDEPTVESLFKFIQKKWGQLDFLIHNVMSKPEGYYQKFPEYSLQTWNKVMEGNLAGAFLCCREAINLMEKKGGSIILTSSIYGIVGPDQRIYSKCKASDNPYNSECSLNLPGAYAASKGGLNAFAKYLATQVACHQIRVNVLIPGGVFDNQESSFHKAYIHRTPLGRMAVWSDFNGAILFLASDASRYMTGANLVVDGGWTAW